MTSRLIPSAARLIPSAAIVLAALSGGDHDVRAEIASTVDYIMIAEQDESHPGERPPATVGGTWVLAGGGCLAIRGPLGIGGLDVRKSQDLDAIGYSRGPNGVTEWGLGDDIEIGPVAASWAISDTASDAHSGQFALCDSPEGMYPEFDSFAATVATPLAIPAAESVVLRFWHHWNFRFNAFSDTGTVEVRTTGDWEVLETYTFVAGFVGSFWPGEVDLSAYAGQTIELRFVTTSSPAYEAEGWTIDDVLLLADGEVVFIDDFESGTGQWLLEGLWGLVGPRTTYVVEDRNFNDVVYPISRDLFGVPVATIDPVSGVVTPNTVGLPTAVDEGIGYLWVVATYGDLRDGTMLRVMPPSFVQE